MHDLFNRMFKVLCCIHLLKKLIIKFENPPRMRMHNLKKLTTPAKDECVDSGCTNNRKKQ